MDFSRQSFVTPDQILADVIKAVGDQEYLFNSKGWYVSQIQQALQDLSFHTLFDEKIIEIKIPQDLNIPLPAGTFNPREMFIFNGDLCNISSKRNLWFKYNYFTKGNGYLASNSGSNVDPFYASLGSRNQVDYHSSKAYANEPNSYQYRRTGNENNYFYNIIEGVIMVSPACLAFQKIAIFANGVGCEIGSAPIVPLFFRTVVKDYVCEVALRNIMVEDPQKGSIWKIYDRNLNKNRTYGEFNGSWYEAHRLIARMSGHEKKCLKEYLAKAAW